MSRRRPRHAHGTSTTGRIQGRSIHDVEVDEALVATVVAEVLARGNRRSQRAVRKEAAREKARAKRRSASTITFPLALDDLVTDHHVGTVTLDVSAVANAYVIRQQRLDPANYPIDASLRPWRRTRLARRHVASARQLPVIASFKDRLLMWVSNELWELDREKMLKAFEVAPRDLAAQLLTLRSVQEQIAKIRDGKTTEDAKARVRLRKALGKMATREDNVGRPISSPRSQAFMEALASGYHELLPRIKNVRTNFRSFDADAIGEFSAVLRSATFVADVTKAKHYARLMWGKKQKPSRVVEQIVADSYQDASPSLVHRAAQLLRTNK